MITGFVISEEQLTNNFFSFVITHGSFELTAIVIAGGGGLVLGRDSCFPATGLESIHSRNMPLNPCNWLWALASCWASQL